MANYQNMLVVFAPDKEEQEALRRAVYLVRKNGGKIKVFSAVCDFPIEATALLSQEERLVMRQEAIDKYIDDIKRVCRHYLDSNILIDIKVVWDNQPVKAILEEIILDKHDLLLKEAHQEEGLGRLLFTPIDWKLLRQCPCPVWMVKDKPWPETATALVAVNLSDDDESNSGLNKKLITESIKLAKVADDKELHLVGAYPEAIMSIAVELPEFDPTKYENAIRGQYLIAMKALRQQYGIKESLTHVEQGFPEKVIPMVAEKINAGIVVLGTVGRTGLSAAFIGNTVERVIDNLSCDLLAIKPDDFAVPDIESIDVIDDETEKQNGTEEKIA